MAVSMHTKNLLLLISERRLFNYIAASAFSFYQMIHPPDSVAAAKSFHLLGRALQTKIDSCPPRRDEPNRLTPANVFSCHPHDVLSSIKKKIEFSGSKLERISDETSTRLCCVNGRII